MGLIPDPEMSASVVKYSLGYIRPYHREMARRLVLGQKGADICRDLGLSESRFSIIVNSPLFKLEVKRLERERDAGVSDVTKTLREVAPVALEVVERTMMMGETPRLRFDAAESWLDRAGYGKSSKVNVEHSGTVQTSHMTDEELRNLVLERAKRIRDEKERKEAEEAELLTTEVEFDSIEPLCPSDGQEGGNGGDNVPSLI